MTNKQKRDLHPKEMKRYFAAGRRTARPLARTESLNSGSLLKKKNDEPTLIPSEDRVGNSFVGQNVHGTYNAQREYPRVRKQLFVRPGSASGFSSGTEAAKQLEAEALRRDPYQIDFLESLCNVTAALAPVIEQTPSYAWVMKQLMEPECFSTFRISWRDDDNNWRMNRGYRIQYSSALGPFRGPIIFDHRLTHGYVRMLGFEQVLKSALCLEDNWGGAVGGADLDVTNKSPQEIERFSQAYLKSLGTVVAGIKNQDILDNPAKLDIALGRFAVAFADECSTLLFGSDKLKNKKCVLSGSDGRSLTIAKNLIKVGAVPVSFSDHTGFLVDENGFDYEDVVSLEKLMKNKGHLEDFRHVSKTCVYYPFTSGKSLWETSKGEACFPTLFTNEISADDASTLAKNGTKIVFECKDRACSENAVRVLKDENVFFVPSKLLLASSSEEVSDDRIHTRVKFLLKEVINASQAYGFTGDNLQAGASILAFRRLASSEMFKFKL